MNFFLNQLKSFLTAMAFLTWLPVPRFECTNKHLQNMNVYLPLVGGIVGAITALILYAANFVFPWPVAAAIALVVQLAITGAFHEDGLADVADSMGALQREKALKILRDSRVGTFGAAALFLLLLMKYVAIVSIEPQQALRNVIAYAAVSRLAGVLILTIGRPIGDSSRLGHTVMFYGRWSGLVIGAGITALIVWLAQPSYPLAIGIVLVSFPLFFKLFFYRKYGGVNGDCAGCTTVLVETALHVIATAKLS